MSDAHPSLGASDPEPATGVLSAPVALALDDLEDKLDADVDRLERALTDAQCRHMDLEALVAELDSVVRQLGDDLASAHRERDALRRRLAALEQGAGD